MVGYGTVTRDIRERKQAEEDMRYLNGELAHRLKNVLTVIQSIAQQTLRNSPDTQTAGKALSARLVALGGATDILTGKSWRSADLRELAERTLAPHGGIGERIVIDGPPIVLQPEASMAFALALHELATNAAKYGALSNDMGIATLHWWVEGPDDDARLSVQWSERGGPPVIPPQRKGFGSVLIERSLRSYFKELSATDYRPDGLILNLRGAWPTPPSEPRGERRAVYAGRANDDPPPSARARATVAVRRRVCRDRALCWSRSRLSWAVATSR